VVSENTHTSRISWITTGDLIYVALDPVEEGKFLQNFFDFMNLRMWMLHLKIFKIEKSLIELFEVFEVWLPNKEVATIIDEIDDFHVMILLLNLA